jgi:hypothetical protein
MIERKDIMADEPTNEIKLTATSYRVRLKRWQAFTALIHGPRRALRLRRDQVSPEIRVGQGISKISVTAYGGGGASGGGGSPGHAIGGPGGASSFGGGEQGAWLSAGRRRECCPTDAGTGHTATCPTLGTQAGGLNA